MIEEVEIIHEKAKEYLHSVVHCFEMKGHNFKQLLD